MHHSADDRHAEPACQMENEANKDGKNVCMCIHKTERGADRLLNLQLGTRKKEDEDREGERERTGGWGVNNTHIIGSTDLFLCLSVSLPWGT